MKRMIAIAALVLVAVLLISGLLYLQQVTKKSPSIVNGGYDADMQKNVLTESDAADIALQAVLKGKITTLSKSCISAGTVSTAADSFDFQIREVHNDACGGDPMTAPRVTSVRVNRITGMATIEG